MICSFSVKTFNTTYLAFALAFSAGVMTYISMVEMMSEAGEHFKSTNINHVIGQTTFFFVGIIICGVMDFCIKKIDKAHSSLEIEGCMNKIKNKQEEPLIDDEDLEIERESHFNSNQDNIITVIQEKDRKLLIEENSKSKTTLINILDDDDDNCDLSHKKDILSHSNNTNSETLQSEERSNLKSIGILTALVIILHNIPEGIATFTSSLSNINIGFILTIAITIHNIPEGLSVAFPIYYSTGSRLKAFLWSSIAGLTELFSALTEYMILKIFNIEITDFTPMVYGIIYSFIASIMIYISFCELLPTAIRYDNKGRITRISFIGGMFIMGISIVLLELM